jgi:aminopeptidase
MTPTISTAFETKLDRYAELAIKVWLNVQPGQRLVILAPIETAALVRLITKHAYQNGSPFVNVVWDDGLTQRMRYEYAPRDSFAEHSEGMLAGLRTAVERGDALLSISAQDPDLLKGMDQDFVAQVVKSSAEHARDINMRVQRNEVNWLGLGMPIVSWAARVFPNSPEQDRIPKLWDAIFQVCRMNETDPLVAWRSHTQALLARGQYLTTKQYDALHYLAPGTDLTVHLPPGHRWIGGGETSTRGIFFIPNIPTEEVFTVPHKDLTRGVVTTTKPLVIRGVVINNFTLTFHDGRVVNAEASNDQSVLDNYLVTDEGATRLGEVALVPNNSPISMSGIIFYNSLFDENASDHFALGKAYPDNLRGGRDMTPEELAAHGVNDSLIHLDFMVGSGEMNVDGITADGAREPVMRSGEWTFQV